MIEEQPFRHLNFKLLSWLLQRFGHIQFQNKDAKSAVSIFKIENCDWFLTRHMVITASKGLILYYTLTATIHIIKNLKMR